MLNYLITHTYSMDTNQCHADLQVVPIFQNIDILGTEVFIFHVTDVAVMVMILASKLLFSEIMRLSAMSLPMHSSYTMRDKHWQHKSSVESRQTWNQDKHKPCGKNTSRTCPTWNQGKLNVESEQTQCGIDKPFVKNK